MPGLPRRFRRPRAELRMDLSKPTPPDLVSGGVLRLRVELLPMEPFRVRCGRLELALLTTRFSRTVLDGYLEYTSEKVYETVALCEDIATGPGDAPEYFSILRLPAAQIQDSGPVRQMWQARARFEVDGHRDLFAALNMLDISPKQGDVPVVDGRRFLPLYEFRENSVS